MICAFGIKCFITIIFKGNLLFTYWTVHSPISSAVHLLDVSFKANHRAGLSQQLFSVTRNASIECHFTLTQFPDQTAIRTRIHNVKLQACTLFQLIQGVNNSPLLYPSKKLLRGKQSIELKEKDKTPTETPQCMMCAFGIKCFLIIIFKGNLLFSFGRDICTLSGTCGEYTRY